jgi:hypothetical protein
MSQNTLCYPSEDIDWMTDYVTGCAAPLDI